MPLLRELNALAKAEDPARPTTQANCCEGRVFAGDVDVPIVAPATDLSGVNRYFGWYYGVVGDLGPHLDSIRRSRPAQPLAVHARGSLLEHASQACFSKVRHGSRAKSSLSPEIACSPEG